MKGNDPLQFICAKAEEYIPVYVKDDSVQLIYLDPPFFKQNILKMYNKDTKNMYSFSDKWKSLDIYLEFIEDILVKCKSKLLNSGLIFLHCDSSANHHLRLLMDKVFGEKYFVNEIIWSYKRWSNSALRLLESHQNILIYSKTGKYKFNRVLTGYSPTTNIDQILQARERDKNGIVKYKKDDNDLIVSIKEKKGVPLRDVWEIPFLNPKAKERVGYPTQKPIELMSRIIKISCDEGDFILDPFCGSGSMGIAAYTGNCIYLGIDNNDDAIRICNKRKRNYHISQSAVKDGNYYNFLNLENEIKSFISSINAIPVERNKGLDGIYSSAEGFVGIRFQRSNESVAEVIALINKAAKEKPLIKKIIIKTHDSDLFEIIPNDIFILESLSYSLNKIIEPIDNKTVIGVCQG
ncbi:MAG: site-specific DNA-methyltransferase [Syntrophomonadaceae bacterium]|jgi:site-specific DNA-methyltransferase (adenine-specific)|nr:site-specific DNA-methyltransferase [Syntrophomonadaceae bacterium]